MLKSESFIRKVDLFSLKLFLQVIEEGQIGRAATREHIAPSAATKRIHDLEEAVGMELFVRTAKGVVPTKAGLLFMGCAQRIVDSVEDFRLDLASLAAGIFGHIGIAAPGLLITHFFASELARFTQRFPEVEIELLHQSHVDALQSLMAGRVDLAIFVRTNDFHLEGIEWVEWKKDRLVVVVPKSHPFAARPAISIKELLDESIVGFSANTAIMASLYRQARHVGREAHVKYSVNTVEAVCSLVGAGLGVALFPSSMPLLEMSDNLVIVDLEGDWVERSYCIGKRVGKSLTPSATELLEQLIPDARFVSNEDDVGGE